MSSERRAYSQYCGLAAAMDVLGERWTLLILRELMLGPRRYNRLLHDLPGIGTNLLADRLRVLSEFGVIRQVSAVSGGRTRAYSLTERGEELREPILRLAKWGMGFLHDPLPSHTVRPTWGFLALEALIDPARASAIDEQYEFWVDDEVFRIVVKDGEAVAERGPAESPSMIAKTDTATFIRIGAQRVSPFDAVASGALAFDGDPAAVVRCSSLLGLVHPEHDRAVG